MAATETLIPFLDLPLVVVALARRKPPRGIDHRVMISPWPDGAEVTVTIRAGDDAPHFFRVPAVEGPVILRRLTAQAVAILQAHKIARGPAPQRPGDPLDISWMGRDS